MILDVDTLPVERMVLRLRGLSEQVRRPTGIMRTAAHGVEHQTKVRIYHTKTSPDGKRWAPWSVHYAKTRKPGHHSLLMDTWHMAADTLRSSSTATKATVFLGHPAGFHMTGTRKMPARPPLGLSLENVADLERWLGPSLEQMAREALKGAPARV